MVPVKTLRRKRLLLRLEKTVMLSLTLRKQRLCKIIMCSDIRHKIRWKTALHNPKVQFSVIQWLPFRYDILVIGYFYSHFLKTNLECPIM